MRRVVPGRRRPISLLAQLVAGLSVMAAAPADATPWNHVDVYKANNACNPCWYVQEGEQSVLSEHWYLGHSLGWYSFAASAGPGLVGSWIRNHVDGNTQLWTAPETHSYSSFDDLVFADGTGVSKPVTFYIKLKVDGGSSAVAPDPSHQGCMVSRLTVKAGNSYSGDYVYSWDATCGLAYPGFISESGTSFSNVYTIGPFNVMSEVPIQVSLYLSMYVSAGVGWGIPGYSEVYGYIFSNLAVGQAAIVSDGFQANSAQAGIVDNWYQQLLAADPVTPPGRLQLAQSAPNPTGGPTRITFELPRRGQASLTIYDVAGREVRRLADRAFEPGSHALVWDGLDQQGARVRAGIYMYRLRQGGEVVSRSMVMLGP